MPRSRIGGLVEWFFGWIWVVVWLKPGGAWLLLPVAQSC